MHGRPCFWPYTAIPAAALSAVPSSAPQLSKASAVDASASALSKLKLQEKEGADRSAGESLLPPRFEPPDASVRATPCPNIFDPNTTEEENVKQEVTAKVEAWGMKYSGHGLRAYLGRMNEVFSAFPPCDDATRLNLRKAPASDVRKVYLQVRPTRHLGAEVLSFASIVIVFADCQARASRQAVVVISAGSAVGLYGLQFVERGIYCFQIERGFGIGVLKSNERQEIQL